MVSALTGIKVVDLSQAAAGPFCTMILADMGADVIKVEPPAGEVSRTFGLTADKGTSGYFMALNRNKKGVTLDLKEEKDRVRLYSLVKNSDILIENYKPGVPERLGVDYANVSKVNPQLIYCSIKGFASRSSYEDLPAFDIMIQGMSGLMSVTGTEEGNRVRIGIPVVDEVSGLFAAIGILSALHLRDKNGTGQKIEVPLMDSAVYLMSIYVLDYFLTGRVPTPLGTKYSMAAPYQAFKCHDGKSLVLGVGNDRLWEKFCKLLRRDDLLNDPRFVNNGMRLTNAKELDEIVRQIFEKENINRDEWVTKLLEAGIPAGAINDVAEMLHDPYVVEQILVSAKTQLNVSGSIRYPRNPIRFEEGDALIARPPSIGEHNKSVFGEEKRD